MGQLAINAFLGQLTTIVPVLFKKTYFDIFFILPPSKISPSYAFNYVIDQLIQIYFKQ